MGPMAAPTTHTYIIRTIATFSWLVAGNHCNQLTLLVTIQLHRYGLVKPFIFSICKITMTNRAL